jgi:flavodoxin-like protein
MRAVVIYESMYGNTHLIADAIGRGLGADAEVKVVPVSQATAELLEGADLLVAGGPTHAHAMSRARTRAMAIQMAAKPKSTASLDPHAKGPGIRDWLARLAPADVKAAAFDTRLHGPGAFTGRASRGIARKLRHHGFTLVARPQSFFVTNDGHLAPGEAERAGRWGQRLAAEVWRVAAAL